MTAQTKTQPAAVSELPDTTMLTRVLAEGYGPGAWHGPDLRAALEGVSARDALVRPAPGRHNIAEVAVHHAWYARSVAGRLAGVEPPPFPLDGEDWFEIADERRLPWREIVSLVEAEQQRIADTIAGIAEGTIASPLSPAERFDVVLGITCHAVYHAGQIQLVKRLTSAARP